MVKKFFKKARKAVKKIIPKEVRAIAPYIAAYYGGPALAAKYGTASGIMSNPAFTKALVAGGTQFAIDVEADLKDVARAGILAAAPDLIETGSAKLAGKFTPQQYRTLDASKGFAGLSELQTVGEQSKLAKDIASAATKVGDVVSEAGALQTIGAQSAIEGASRLAEIQQDEIDAYNRRLQEQGIRDKTQRRSAIRDIYLGVGYDEDYVDSMLDRYGYKGGGISYTMDDILDMASEATKKKRKEKEEEDEDELSEYIDIGSRGLMSLAPKQKPMPIRPLQMAEGGDVMSPEEYFTGKEKFMKQKQMEDMIREYERYRDSMNMKRDRAAEGGMMNLGGNEMDLRGGGFVPIGKKEKADDVPARLSKNEFVMTADAVRGAGRGDINEGARRMYQTMDKLEAMA